MDKYEYKLKFDEIKSLMSERNYEAAVEIADTINWRKIKNVNALVLAGEAYEHVERYDEAKDLLLMAYDRSPIGKKIIYQLAGIAIKTQEFDQAEEYYDEFVEIAPHDSLKYVLRYRISKAKNEPVEAQIEILEELKEQEYTEEWAYELAYLYHKAGQTQKCLDSCDELFLWFGDGHYVERALELKMLYQPLTAEQESKYRKFREKREGMIEVRAEDTFASGEIVPNTIQIATPVVTDADRFNTQNLQEELVRGMQQIMDATEKETVSDTMDTIKKLVEEIPYLQALVDEDAEEKEARREEEIETNAEIDGSINLNFQEILGEEYDGQMRMFVPEQSEPESQVSGQMTIEDVLAEWEKTKRAAELAMQEAEQRKLEAAKARALQEAGDIMDRLSEVIPQIDAGVTPRELVEQAYETPSLETMEAASIAMADVNERLQEEIDKLTEEFQVPIPQPTKELPVDTITSAAEALLNEEIEQFLQQTELVEETEEAYDSYDAEEVVEEDEATAMEDISMGDASMGDASMEADEVETDENEEDFHIPEVTVDLEEERTEVKKATGEMKKRFSYFLTVNGMEDQIDDALNGVAAHLCKDQTSSTGNLIVQGADGSGKTMLSTNLVKVLQQMTGKPNRKIGKIQGEALNHKNLYELMKKIEGGCLIIEKAGDLKKETEEKLSDLMEENTSGLLVILEDTEAGIIEALRKDEGFASKFTEKLIIPAFNNDELVTFAKTYANEAGYGIDEMAILALYERINSIQKLDEATTLIEVKEIIDEAIDRAEKGGFKKMMSILTSSRYDENNYIILREKDFEVI